MLTVGNIIPLFLEKINNYSDKELISIAYIVIEEILGLNKINVIINNGKHNKNIKNTISVDKIGLSTIILCGAICLTNL